MKCTDMICYSFVSIKYKVFPYYYSEKYTVKIIFKWETMANYMALLVVDF